MSRAERIVRGLKAAAGAVGLDDVIEDLAVFGGKKAAPRAPAKPAAAKPTTPAQPKPPRKKITAYHATPHRFEPEVKVRNVDDGFEFYRPRPADLRVSPGLEVVEDYPLGRFRLDKMGSGAGAQMYGSGIYAAEAPDVARTYRRGNTAAGAANPTIGGVDANLVYSNLLEKADRLPISAGRPLYDQAALLENIINTGDLLDVEKAMAAGDYAPDTADWFNREIAGKWDAPGALYQVGLDVDPAKMLSWDTPMTAQPEVMQSVRPLLQKYQIEGIDNGKYPTLGGDLYHQLRLRSDSLPLLVFQMLYRFQIHLLVQHRWVMLSFLN
jgi:hypothetical protein